MLAVYVVILPRKRI